MGNFYILYHGIDFQIDEGHFASIKQVHVTMGYIPYYAAGPENNTAVVLAVALNFYLLFV